MKQVGILLAPGSWPAQARAAVLTAVAVSLAGAGGYIYLKRPEAFDHDRVWTIGTDNTQPYHTLDPAIAPPGGPARGMAADVIEEAARRAGIKLAWKLFPKGPTATINARGVDLWPLISTKLQSPTLRVSEPYLRNVFILVSTNPRFVDPSAKASIRRITHVGYPLVSSHARQLFPDTPALIRPNRDAAFATLCAGEADVVLLEARTAQHLALHRPPGCETANFYPIGADLPPIDLGIASTPEAAPVANRLRREIDAMMADRTMAAVMQPWHYYYAGESELVFREESAKAAHRLMLGLALILSILSMLLLVLFFRVRRAQRAAVAANTAKSQFLANMSHEIRTPLNGIIGSAEILDKSPLQPHQKEFVAMLRSSGQNLLCIVNDVLDLARVESGHLELQPRVCAVGSLIEDAVGPFRTAARDKGLTLSLSGIESLPRAVNADPVRLRQIVLNLVGNAIKFTSSGSVRVDVTCSIQGDVAYTTITVRDTGIGIAPEAHDRLFEKFYQADSSISRRFGGTGLGLSIAKALATEMGGAISFESSLGEGSTFRLSVPLDIARPDQLPVNAPAEVGLTTEKQGTILLAEDNSVNERIVRALLERAGHCVTSVKNGRLAVEQVREGRYDAVLMDCQMPEMDGYQAAMEIRKWESSGKGRIPIIALTASAMKGERERCLAVGMDDFISKPIDVADLRRALNHWLS